jgi:hypothetical protein
LSSAWERLELEKYGLEGAQEALEKVARGDVIKALIDPSL